MGGFCDPEVIWDKPNCKPESVTNRPTISHECLFLFVKSKDYYYDADAIREPHVTGGRADKWEARSYNGKGPAEDDGRRNGSLRAYTMHPLGRNKRSVWHVVTRRYVGAHFAVFPPALIEPCVLAGAPQGTLVLDPFCGSGTVGEVCTTHRRDFVGIDISAGSVELARTRLSVARQDGMINLQLPFLCRQ